MLNLNELRKTIIYTGILIILPILSFFISCSSYENLPKGQSNISFHSVYENDTLNLKVNDSIRFKNHKIDMIFEWGISKNTWIYVKGNEFRVSGTFKTTHIIDKELGLKIRRNLKFDTILKTRNGRYIDFFARGKEIIIEQSKNIRVVE